MGLSSNQARFLSLTSRQIDLEHRVQQICQRRLRLSNEMQRAARSYNDQTNDRRLFINTLGGFSSAQNNVIGPITHDNLLDNNVYELLSASNLHDNGLHVFVNGSLLSGGTTTLPTGKQKSFSQAEVGAAGMGDWVCPNPPYTYQLVSTGSTANPYNITPPANDGSTPTGTSSGAVTVGTIPSVGVANTTNQYGAWSAGSIVQNPTTGFTTATYTRTVSVEVAAAPTTTTVPVTQTQITDLGTSTGTVNIGGVNFNQYTFNDYTGQSVTRLAIETKDGISAETRLRTLASAGVAISDNFILMEDINLDGGEWGVIDNYSGLFDGNLHTITGMDINTYNPAGTGLFGTLNGTVKNLLMVNSDITLSGSNIMQVGTIAGILGATGNVTNINLDNLKIDITDTSGSTSQYPSYIGGVIGTSQGGSIDRLDINGNLNIHNPTTDADNIGGVVGNSTGKLTRSMIGVNVNIDGTSDCVGVIDACSGSIILENVAVTGRIVSGDPGKMEGSHPDMGITSGGTGTIINSYRVYQVGGSVSSNDNGTYGLVDSNADGNYDAQGIRYWNSTTGTIGDLSASSASLTGTWDTNIWDTSSNPPTIKFAAINTEQGTFPQHTTNTWTQTLVITDNPGVTSNYIANEYIETMVPDTSLSSEDLEKGLRDGSIKLAKHADAMTQEVITDPSSSEKFEYVDWRIQPVISDDLYEANDEAAQYLYEKVIRDVNAQDKQLQLEQTSVETEYNAITNEKEAVEKIIDTNAKNSFKYFS